MKRNRAWGWAAVLVLWSSSIVGCSDVGDSSAVPGQGGGGDDAAAGTPVGESGVPNQSSGEAASEAAPANAPDAGAPEVGSTVSDSGGADSSHPDSTVSATMDSGSPGTTTPETGGPPPVMESGSPSPQPEASVPDTGTTNPGTPDAGMDAGPATSDAGPQDAGGLDATVADTGVDAETPDTGTPDSGASDSGEDTGTPDAGNDAGRDSGSDTGASTDSGGSPTPCTTAPCAASGANSVHCAASANGVCTATEALIVSYDIAYNGQGPGENLTTSCYTCMVVNACIDGSGASGPGPTGNGSGDVTNSECGDPNGPGVNFPFDNANVSGASMAATQRCLDALNCALNSNGSSPNCTKSEVPHSVSNCYCGANTGSNCLTSPASPIGVCASNIATDLGTTDPTTVEGKFTDTTYSAGGVGLAILNCALTAPATAPAAATCPT
ncbi:MAG: hypothetical protein WBY94_19335, partial [Polyangiaceae bacterium]